MAKAKNKTEIFYESEKIVIYEEKNKDSTAYYREHKVRTDEGRVKIFEEYKDKVVYYFTSEYLPQITFEGFDVLPDLMNKYGYGFERKELTRFFVNNLKIGNRKCFVSESKKSKISKTKLTFNYSDLERLVSSINQEQYACNQTKNTIISNFLSDNFPELKFEYKPTNNNKNLILRNLNEKLIEQLNADEVEQIGNFFVKATEKYSRKDLKERMAFQLQETAKILTLRQIIKEYEGLLKQNPAESSWQKFFEKYITLFDNRYVKQIKSKNIGTGITKYPDLALVDIYGYVDFYELKKSGAKLLDYDTSHKTFYWSKEVSKTIAQVSDYLQKAKDNSHSFAKAVKQETETETQEGLSVDIIRPKAIIVLGHSKKLNTAKKKEHFKNLRESLKDIEFVLYDELLERLNNLLNSIAEGN